MQRLTTFSTANSASKGRNAANFSPSSPHATAWRRGPARDPASATNLIEFIDGVLAAGPDLTARPASRCREAMSNVAALLHGPADAALLRSVRESSSSPRRCRSRARGGGRSAPPSKGARLGRPSPPSLPRCPTSDQAPHAWRATARLLDHGEAADANHDTQNRRWSWSVPVVGGGLKAPKTVKDDVLSRVRTALAGGSQDRDPDPSGPFAP